MTQIIARLIRALKRTPAHQPTDEPCWHGGYRCTCGAPWLIRANRCLDDPPTTTQDTTDA